MSRKLTWYELRVALVFMFMRALRIPYSSMRNSYSYDPFDKEEVERAWAGAVPIPATSQEEGETMAGLPEPKVVGTLANRGKMIDAAVDAAVTPKKPFVDPDESRNPSRGDAVARQDGPPPERVHKPITAAEAVADMAALKARQAADDAKAAKGLPKPGILERAKKLVGM